MVRLQAKDLQIRYGERTIVDDLSIAIPDGKITVIIGSNGCGKSTLLRCLNRMNDEIVGCKTDGKIRWGGINILGDMVIQIKYSKLLKN